ncbi:PPK2 family polyphosphate kinase [Paenibacillus qinlingensis]|uniref:PPK2 family polyphosphate:nucleotide phosphotransferase n=1 Tax=Paenibacillus qinlingensis TaxID=1837343 RepID=A0ABU1P517_9BACL|nr:PPK2 family polyphosphate kinase [Paenibacillus qinlingensis]MDR6554312.1 PPK2 family polyphosphate:nucleotide phosphotransferase [Paenibacillus qinlingensis]
MPYRHFRLDPDKKTRLANINPDETEGLHDREEAESQMERLAERLQELQDILYAQKQLSVLFVIQGMDCSGKDGVVKHALGGLHPQGFEVHSFRTPTEEEAAHDFLWRAHKIVPAKGMIGAFIRSYYEDVLITRVHGMVTDSEAKRRFKQINQFEKLLESSGVKIVKIFLHISKDFQLAKLKNRLMDPTKHWKFDKNDLVERESWKAYEQAYEAVFKSCSSATAPWYVVPANHRWYRDWAVLQIAVHALESMSLAYPDSSPELEQLLVKISSETH